MNEAFHSKKDTPIDSTRLQDSDNSSRKLQEHNQPEALKRWVDQNLIDEPTYQKRRHGRSSSSKVDSFSFQAQQSDVIDEENVLELLANQVDNKTIVQYYKNSLKKDHLTAFKRQTNRNLSVGSSRLPNKLPVVQSQAAALLFERLTLVFREYFRVFTIKCGLANPINKRDRQTSIKSNFSEVRKILHNIKQLNLTESENSPQLGPTNLSTPNAQNGFLPSFPVSAVNSPHAVADGIKESLANPELKYQSEGRPINENKTTLASKYSYLPNSKKATAYEEDAVEGENSPKSSASIKLESQDNLANLGEYGDYSNQQLQVDLIKARSQEGIQNSKQSVVRNTGSTGDINYKAQLKKRDTTPMHPRLELINRTAKSDFSLDSQIELKQKQEVVELNGLKGYFISQGCTEKSISHCRMDSSSSIASNEALFKSRSTLQGSPLRGMSPQASRKESKYQEFTLHGVLEKQKVLTQFWDLLTNIKIRNAFEKLKHWTGNSPASILTKDGSGYKIGAFPTFSDLPQPFNHGLALELDQITETDSREGASNNKDVQSQRQTAMSARDYGNEIRKMQQKMKGILNLEIVCSQLMRKSYRCGFENICRASFDSSGEKEYSGSFRRNPNEKELKYHSSHDHGMNSGYDESSHLTHIETYSIRKVVAERGRHLSRTIKNGEDQNSSLMTKFRDHDDTVKELDVASLEERLERSLEKKLESRITQNLDEKLRAKLQKELIRLLSYDYDEQDQKKDISREHSIQTDTLNDKRRFEFDRRINVNTTQENKLKDSVDKLGSEQDYFDSKSFSPILDKRTPFFYNGVPGLNNPLDEKGQMSSNEIREFSTSLFHQQEDSPYPVDSQTKNRINQSGRGNAFEENTRQSEPIKYPFRQAQSVERQNFQSQPRFFMNMKNPYALGSVKTDNPSLNRTTEDKIVLSRLFSDNKDSTKVSDMPSTNYTATPNKREYTEKGLQKHRSVSSFQELGPKGPIFANKLDYSLNPLPKSVFLGEMLEKLAYERIRQAFYKIQRPYLLQSLKSYKKKRTLNYLLFAKKVEKIYIMRIRSAFTKLCLKNGSRTEKKPAQKLVKRFELRMMKDFFIKIKSHSKRQLSLQNSLGKLSSLLHVKKLRVLSEAFYYIASSSLLKKEYLLNLTLMCLQFSEMRKSKMRSAFSILKGTGRSEIPQEYANKMLLKNVLQETKLRWHFSLKQAFTKWKGTASNLSSSLMHEMKSFEHAKAIRKHLPNSLKSIFGSRDRINKCFAFYKLKNHTKNLKGAVALYGVLNHQIINRLRTGYDSMSNSERNENERRVKLQNLCQLFKTKIQKAFMRILIHGQTPRQPNVNINHKKGLLRLCVVTEDIKQNLLLHTLKMLELYNIHKKNQKSLYINLALKLFLLFDEKETTWKKEFLDALFFKTEKGALQQKALSKLLRRSQTKNLAFFFNKFKSEIVNLKLNHSIVNLAIKNIILAIEKIGKLQRTRKTQAFRKLNALLWDKQLGKENPTMSLSEEKQSSYRESILKLKDFSITESMELGLLKPTEEDHSKKLIKSLLWLDNKLVENKMQGFNAIYDVCKRRKLTERLQILGTRLFKKTIYKRCFLSFAQLKYYADKKRQRVQSIKLNTLLPLLKSLDKSVSRDKKHYFRKWKALVELETQTLKTKIQDFTRLRTKRLFDKWKVVITHEKSQIKSGAAKLEEISLKKLMKFYKLAFKKIKNFKAPPAKLGSLTDRSQTDQVPLTAYKKSAAKLTKGKSIQLPSHIQKKPSMTMEKKANPKTTLPISGFDSIQNTKKGQNKPQTDNTGPESPRSRFSRGSNLSLGKESGVNTSSVSQASSQASNKITSPSSSNFKPGKK